MEKELKYLSYEYKKITNLGKFFVLSKIHKRLENVPGRSVIYNYGKPTEKVSEFLDHHLKPIMQSSRSCIKDSGDCFEKIKSLGSIPENAILVIVRLVSFYPTIPMTENYNHLNIH